jgi:DNA-binding CsgD family transcriptional regulator
MAKRKRKPQPQGAHDVEMLDMIVAGKGCADMAKALRLTPGTCRVYLHRMYKRIGVANKTAAAVYWVKRQASIVDESRTREELRGRQWRKEP